MQTATLFPFTQGKIVACPEHWRESVVYSECTLHQVAPFIGKLKSSIARSLVEAYTKKRETVYDPFCGSGGIALETWIAGRNVIANDLSPYALLLTRAKLRPIASLDTALDRISDAARRVQDALPTITTENVPQWVAEFFHQETLREILGWVATLRERREYQLLAALLGILHHQRPGFLSFPSSHTVPYLREHLFPRKHFPLLYTYRSVRDRLERKLRRTFKRLPQLDRSVKRRIYEHDASEFVPPVPIDAIISSPPYMQQLDYGRDNRLRLWFLGIDDWQGLDDLVSPSEEKFLHVMRKSFILWKRLLGRDKHCVLVLGDSFSRRLKQPIPSVIAEIATREVGGYKLISQTTSIIPKKRRVRRDCRGNRSETVLVLKRG
jgi:hypothetical protein